jgi:hypothetical protein
MWITTVKEKEEKQGGMVLISLVIKWEVVRDASLIELCTLLYLHKLIQKSNYKSRRASLI